MDKIENFKDGLEKLAFKNLNPFYNKTINMEITNDLIKIIQTKEEDNIINIKNFAVEGNEKTISKNKIHDFNRLYEIIFGMLKESNFKADKVRMVVPDEILINRVFTIDYVGKEDIEDEVFAALVDQLPVDILDVYFSYQVIESESGKNHTISTISVDKKIIDSYIDLCKKLKLTPIGIYPASTAIINLMKLNKTKTSELNILLDFKDNCTNVITYKGDSILHLNSINKGGDFLVSRLLESVEGVTEESVYKFKRQNDLTKEDDIKDGVSIIMQSIYKIITGFNSYNRDKGYKLDKIIVKGDGLGRLEDFKLLEEVFGDFCEEIIDIDYSRVQLDGKSSSDNLEMFKDLVVGASLSLNKK